MRSLTEQDKARIQSLKKERAENPQLYEIERKAERRQGKRIKAFRIAKGMTEAELGKAMSLSGYEVSKYESGDRSFNVEIIEAFSTALKIEPTKILGE